ncbi:hypothetical protein IWX85_001456 [Polaromonas sp. CG_9.11]|nr:hypothetical protein [Polaromonas sp. CG_9.11]
MGFVDIMMPSIAYTNTEKRTFSVLFDFMSLGCEMLQLILQAVLQVTRTGALSTPENPFRIFG